jgi:hypothetical protein
MIEGEEESVNKTLVETMKKLKNDVILISDTGMISNQQPSINRSARTELCRSGVTGPNRDLHSGLRWCSCQSNILGKNDCFAS